MLPLTNPTRGLGGFTLIGILYLTCFCVGNIIWNKNYSIATPTTENVSFNPKFGVYFDLPLNFEYNSQDVLPYLKIVRSRFSTIILNPFSTYSFEHISPGNNIPSLVAHLNKLDNSTVPNATRTTTVYLKFSIILQNQFEASTLNHFMSTFENTLHLADGANKIFNGTVEHIVLEVGTSNLSGLGGILDLVTYARNKSNAGEFKYKLGLTIPLDYCSELAVDLNNPAWGIFAHLDFSIFIMFSWAEMSAPDFYHCSQRQVEKCRKIMEKKTSQLEVVTATFLLSEDARDLIWYWRKLNDWVEKTNSTAFMKEAFDHPGKKYPNFPQLASLGWWHVQPSFPDIPPSNRSNSDLSKTVLTIREKVTLIGTEALGNIPSNSNYNTCSPADDDISKSSTCYNKFHKITETLHMESTEKSLFKHDQFIVYFSPQFHRFPLMNEFDENELLSLLKLVQTQFSNIVTTLTRTLLTDIQYIPNAVAKLNLLNSRQQTAQPQQINLNKPNFLRLYLTYDLEDIPRQFNEVTVYDEMENLLKIYFDVTKSKADEANGIFNGTVSHIAFSVHSLQLLRSLIEHLKYAVGKIHHSYGAGPSDKPSYKLGIILYISECGNSAQHVNPSLEHLFPFVSFVMFTAPIPFAGYLPQGIDMEAVFVEEYQVKLEFCLRKMAKSYPNTEVMFSAMWPDTHISGEVNVSRLAWVWERMNEWAIKRNTTVLMYEAFDNFSRRQKQLSYVSVGWWRHENSCPCRTNITGYKFAAKRDLLGCALTPQPESAPKLGFDSKPVVLHQWNPNDSFRQISKEVKGEIIPEFDRSRFVVYYDTLGTTDNTVFFQTEGILDGLVRFVHRRFSKILLKPTQEGNVIYKDLYTLIPKAAARFNLQQKLTPHNSVSSGCAVQVILSFDLTSVPLLTETEEARELTSFEVVSRLADDANAIHPKTVEQLMLHYEELNEENVNFVVNQLQNFLKKGGKNGFLYQIGIRLTSDDCYFPEGDFEESYLFRVLHHVNFVIFTHWTTQKEWEEGVQQSITGVTEEFTRCKNMIGNTFPVVTVGLFTSWSDADENGVRNYTALIDYWREMNNFAVTANITVILSKAFDSTDRVTGREHYTGWWKPIGDEYTGPRKREEEFAVLEEKYQLINSESKKQLWGESPTIAGSTSSFAVEDGCGGALKILVVELILALISGACK